MPTDPHRPVTVRAEVLRVLRAAASAVLEDSTFGVKGIGTMNSIEQAVREAEAALGGEDDG